MFLLIKGVIQQKNQVLFSSLFTWAFSLYPCSAFLLSPPKCLLFLNKPIKQSKLKPVVEAQPSLPILCSQKELEKGFCWWQKWFLVGPHPFSSPALGCLLLCSALEVTTSNSSLVNIWNRAKILNPKGGLENGTSLPCATTMRKICIFSLFVIWGFLRVLSSFDESPFGVWFLLFSIGFPWLRKRRKEGWIDVCLIPSQMICVRKWLTAGCFLCLLCPSFCLLLTRHLPVRANGCVPSHASHLAAGSFLLLRNLKAAFAEVLRAVSSSQCLGKCLPAALLKTQGGCSCLGIKK